MITVIPGTIRSFLTFSIGSETSSACSRTRRVRGRPGTCQSRSPVEGLALGLGPLPDLPRGRCHPRGRVRVAAALDRLPRRRARPRCRGVWRPRSRGCGYRCGLPKRRKRRVGARPAGAVLTPDRHVERQVDDDRGLPGAGLGVAASEPGSRQQVLDDEPTGEVRLQVLEQGVFEGRASAVRRRLAFVGGVAAIQPRQALGAPLGRLVEMRVDQEALRSIQSGSPLMLPCRASRPRIRIASLRRLCGAG